MPFKLLNTLKKNVIWLLLLAIMLVPQLRNPIQVILHKGFSYINWISIIEDSEPSKLNELVVVNELGVRLLGGDLKGRVVFINFWATWCAPCIAEMASIQSLYDEYGDEVVFLMVSNEHFDRTTAFKNEKGYDFKVYRPETIPDNIYGRSIPRTVIINVEGHIVVEKAGAVDWNSNKIRVLLDQLLTETI